MKTRPLFPMVVIALAVVAPLILVFLVPGDHTRGVQTVVTLGVISIGAILLAHALFQRVAQGGPWNEFWPTLLLATGFLAYGGRVAADVPLHTAAGIALTLGGLVVAFVGILLYARARRDRQPVAR